MRLPRAPQTAAAKRLAGCFFPLSLIVLLTFIDFAVASSIATDSSSIHRHTTDDKLQYSGMTFTNERYCPNVTIASSIALESLQHLATTGTNYVALVVTQYQTDITSTQIYPVYGAPIRCTATPTGYCVTASDADLIATIKTIHALGMKVFLKPHIDLIAAQNSKSWRGDIGTGMTPSEWKLWFESYTKMISHYAALGQEHGADFFSVSCELVVASQQETYWRTLVIPAVRGAYTRGLITSSANWGDELNNKAWWDAVDVIGADEYEIQYFWALINGTYPTVPQLLEKWAAVEMQFVKLHAKFNKSVVFTEIGYCSGVNAECYSNTDAPLPSPPTTPDSLASQVAQYEAMFLAMSKYPWWKGVFWWNWATDAAFGGTSNTCMDPKFKPAEDVLRKWYRAEHPRPSPPTYPATCKCWL